MKHSPPPPRNLAVFTVLKHFSTTAGGIIKLSNEMDPGHSSTIFWTSICTKTRSIRRLHLENRPNSPFFSVFSTTEGGVIKIASEMDSAHSSNMLQMPILPYMHQNMENSPPSPRKQCKFAVFSKTDGEKTKISSEMDPQHSNIIFSTPILPYSIEMWRYRRLRLENRANSPFLYVFFSTTKGGNMKISGKCTFEYHILDTHLATILGLTHKWSPCFPGFFLWKHKYSLNSFDLYLQTNRNMSYRSFWFHTLWYL